MYLKYYTFRARGTSTPIFIKFVLLSAWIEICLSFRETERDRQTCKNSKPLNHKSNTSSPPSFLAASISPRPAENRQAASKERKRTRYFAKRLRVEKQSGLVRIFRSFTRPGAWCIVSYINVVQEGGRTSCQRADAPRN